MPDSPPKIALCVGINYVGAAPAIPALRFAEHDAQELARVLHGRGFQTSTLLGAAATRRAMVQRLKTFAAQPAGLCVLYFSGHGMHGTGVLDQDRAYFVPYDFDPDDSGLALPLVDIAGALERRFQAESAFALFDCCYAGSIAEVAIDPTVSAQSWRQELQLQGGGTGRAVAVADGGGPLVGGAPGCRALIAACPANVEAREWGDLQHGVMTYYALQGWQGKAADPATGEITDGALYGYISHELQRLQLPPLARAAQIGEIVLDQIPVLAEDAASQESDPDQPPWPPDCRLIDATVIAAAGREAQAPSAASMYAQPGRQTLAHIVAGQDIRREPTDAILAAIRTLAGQPGLRFLYIVGDSGSGKSTLLLRLAYELAQGGEWVLMAKQDDDSIEIGGLAAACATASMSGRRVTLLLDDAYRFQSGLITTLAAFVIPNLTVVITTRESDIPSFLAAPAPALPLASAGPAAPPADERVHLNGLTPREARDLLTQIARYTTVQAPDPAATLAPYLAPVGADRPVLGAVIDLLSVGGVDAYVLARLLQINNGRQPTWANRAGWTAFMHVYYAVAVCHAWGATTPHALLPILTAVAPPDIETVLCAPGGESGLARQYLVGRCRGYWETDHHLIAACVMRLVGAPDSSPARLIGLLQTLAAAPTADSACLIGTILHRLTAGAVGVNPLAPAPREDLPAAGATAVVAASGGAAAPRTEASLAPATIPVDQITTMLADAQFKAALQALHAVARVPDLVGQYAPAYLRLGEWTDLRDVTSRVLQNPRLAAPDRARALDFRAVANRRLDQIDAALADLQASLKLYTHPLTAYLLACVHSLRGEVPAALQYLQRALAAFPPYRAAAQTDPDLAAARADPGFAQIIAG